MVKKRGLFISVDGVDGSGKSTAIPFIKEAFENWGYEVVVTREPGGSSLAEKIRTLLLNEHMSGMTEALLFAAARSDHIETVIRPALDAGKVVITDRFHDSTYAYQYHARGIGDIVNVLEKIVVLDQDMVPDMTFYFNATKEVCDSRLDLRSKSEALDRFDTEKEVFRAKVREGFEKRFHRDTANERRIVKVNANGDLTSIRGQIVRYIDSFFL